MAEGVLEPQNLGEWPGRGSTRPLGLSAAVRGEASLISPRLPVLRLEPGFLGMPARWHARLLRRQELVGLGVAAVWVWSERSVGF